MTRRLACMLAAAVMVLAMGEVGVASEDDGGLARGLRHPLASARQTAAETIGDSGVVSPAVMDALLQAVQDENIGIRRAAIGSIGRLAIDADRTGRLVPALSDRDWVVRERAAKLFAVVEIRDGATVETVARLLKSEDWSVRRAATIALSGVRPDQDDIFAAVVAALSERMLNDEQWQVRSSAAYAIGKQGRRAQGALPDLFDVLRYDEPMVAETAIAAIGRIGPSGLDVALTDSFPSVRLGAARIVGALGASAAVTAPALAKTMDERSIPMRRAAALALGAIGPAASQSVSALANALKDSDWSVRWASARALGKLGASAAPAAAAMAAALRDPDSRVCEAAAFALERMGPTARASVAALADAVREQPSDVCKTIDATAASHEAQMDLGWTVRWAAARALGSIDGDAGATTSALQTALTDSMWQVRGVAALSLGRVKTASSAKMLITGLGDEAGAVRKAAAMALGEIGPAASAAIPFLRPGLDDTDISVQEAVRNALFRIAGEKDLK